MSFVEWSEDYELGITEIDRQHRQLIDMINDLNKGIADGEANSVLVDIFERCNEYIQRHFLYEEALLCEHDYPQSSEHHQSHQSFIAQIESLRQEFESDPGTGTAVELMHYLYHWLIDHIQYTDRQYANYLKERGIK